MRALSRDATASAAALRVSPALALVETARNRRLTLSPTMPALDRYTGVVFDALSAATLDPDARAFALSHVLVHSALFGPVLGGDLLPAYRLSQDSRVPGLALGSLRAHWGSSASEALASLPGLLLDFRSEGYVGLGPVSARPSTFFLRVFSVDGSGQRRALNHFNKHAKGELTRALVSSGEDFSSVDDLVSWARAAGFSLTVSGPAELSLVV